MSILSAYMVPHPPVILPGVGKGKEAELEKTAEAYKRAAEEIRSQNPDTVVIISSHIEMYSDYFHIVPGEEGRGDMADFGAPDICISVKYDTGLRDVLCALCDECSIKAGTLGQRNRGIDHGSLIPLYFLGQAYRTELPPVIRIGVSGLMLHEHYRLGMLIRQAACKAGRSIAVIASGDLSHRLSGEGSYGYAKEGPEYDRRIMETMSKGDFEELFSFEEDFCDKAGECGHRCFAVLAGVFDCISVTAEKLSYEAPFGVGYGICRFLPCSVQNTLTGKSFYDIYTERIKAEVTEHRGGEDAYVRLARTALEAFVLRNEITKVPEDAPDELRNMRAGAFVCIKKHGRLRGCIGTVSPVMGNVGEEIIMNAMSVAVRDSRFAPVTADELDYLTYTVDIIGETEPVSSLDELDVKKYGIIVTRGDRRGVLLPNLEGVDTVEEQVDIARRKAGIAEGDSMETARFKVVRHTA